MTRQALEELRRELKSPQLELDAFEQLPDAQLTILLQAYRDARAGQRRALHRAVEDSLSFIPALLRIPIKKILFRK
ncbi:MAG: hypothetical protein ACRETN_12730 [Nevskiales bacterium]